MDPDDARKALQADKIEEEDAFDENNEPVDLDAQAADAGLKPDHTDTGLGEETGGELVDRKGEE